MKQADHIDQLLRESLVNWALEDLFHPIKRATLEQMSRSDWHQHLYRDEEEKEAMKKWQTPNQKRHALQEMIRVKGAEQDQLEPDVFTEEVWVQDLLKAIFYALKEAFHGEFEANYWGMRRMNQTGMYVLGPKNAYGDIFFRFKIGVKNGMVYWSMEKNGRKVRPKGFEHVPQILKETVQACGHDLLIRRNSKNYGLMLPTGNQSRKLLIRLRQMKEIAINIGNDAHGTLWIQDDRKRKKLRLLPATSENFSLWQVLKKETDQVLAEVVDTEDVLHLKKQLTSYDSFL